MVMLGLLVISHITLFKNFNRQYNYVIFNWNYNEFFFLVRCNFVTFVKISLKPLFSSKNYDTNLYFSVFVGLCSYIIYLTAASRWSISIVCSVHNVVMYNVLIESWNVLYKWQGVRIPAWAMDVFGPRFL